MGVLLAIGAAVTYGIGDFLGGVASKRANIFAVVLTSQAAGSLVLAVALPLAAGPFDANALTWGAASGIAGGAGVTLLYRGLAIGRMSVVAPVTGVVAAALPVLFGVATGERPTAIAVTGVVVALLSVVLVSAAPGDGSSARTSGVVEALGAGAAFGAFFILLSRAGGSGLWPLVGMRAASLALVGLIVVIGRQQLRIPRDTLAPVVGSGVLDVAANLLYLFAARRELLSLVAVITSMYPASTVLLARFVLNERLARSQVVALPLAAVGVTLIASG